MKKQLWCIALQHEGGVSYLTKYSMHADRLGYWDPDAGLALKFDSPHQAAKTLARTAPGYLATYGDKLKIELYVHEEFCCACWRYHDKDVGCYEKAQGPTP